MRITMRTHLIATAIATLAATTPATTTLAAQDAPPSAGVLIGTQACDYISCRPATTYWIVRQGDRVRIVARGTHLLVPRRDGFWWLAAEDGDNGSRPPEDPDETAWRLECDSIALGLKPAPDSATSVRTPDDSMERSRIFYDEMRWSAFWAVRADVTGTGPRATPRVVRTTDYGQLSWLWVGSEWLAFSEYTVEHSEDEHVTEKWFEGVFPFAAFDRTGSDSMPPTMLAPKGPAFRRAELACLRAAGATEDRDDLEVPGERAYARWTVRRGATSWMLVPQLVFPRAIMDGPATPCEAPRGLGAELFGHDRVTVPWSAIKDVLPEATTAFQSPTGDLLLVQQDSALYAFLPAGGRPGSIVARLPVDGNVVMAEWATGAGARRWHEQVPAMLQRGATAFRSDSASARPR
jgi:hypothetical protein